MPAAALEHWASEHGREAVTLEHVVRLAGEYGVSAQMVRYRLATPASSPSASRSAQARREIADGEHLVLAGYLGLSAPRRPARRAPGRAAAHPGPAAGRRRSGDLLAGELDAGWRSPSARARRPRRGALAMLVNLGLDAAGSPTARL